MRRRRKSDQVAETVIVTTDDGKTFRCSIASTGRETEPHWALIDEQAEQYLGPPVLPDHSPQTIRRQITEWWQNRTHASRSASPQSGAPDTGEKTGSRK
jgi:hypothetical protein